MVSSSPGCELKWARAISRPLPRPRNGSAKSKKTGTRRKLGIPAGPPQSQLQHPESGSLGVSDNRACRGLAGIREGGTHPRPGLIKLSTVGLPRRHRRLFLRRSRVQRELESTPEPLPTWQAMVQSQLAESRSTQAHLPVDRPRRQVVARACQPKAPCRPRKALEPAKRLADCASLSWHRT